MSNVPKLRFKEFSANWEEKTLGDIGKVTMCKRVMKDQTLPIGDIPFYKIGTFGKIADAFISNELYQTFRTKYSYPNKGDILIAASGATYGKTVVFDGSPSYFQDSNIVWIVNNEKLVYNNFLNFIYRKIKWRIEESTIPRLYNGVISSTSLKVPSLDEQEKIASFLTSIDTKIEQLIKKEKLLQEYKKGIMQKIFNQEIRFKADDGIEFPEWEEKKLGKIINEYNEKNKERYPQYTIGKKGINLLEDSRHNIEEHKIFKLNDFVIGIGIDEMNVNIHIENGCCSPIYNVFHLVDSELLPLFAFYYLPQFLSRNKRMFTKKSTRREYEISKIDLLKEIILLPCFQEQTKIANFLSSIDTKIEQTQKQLESSKEFKKALLQQMFV